uniref:Uncharacterized protein n=1 Tax=Branchiostoma floridae TaxID=7739 RepID=C3Y005_BRAFL|eukprot:XP_002610361.1 hypothetical protein BRAFLDRAFT_72437 [Branchiostoma floridae]
MEGRSASLLERKECGVAKLEFPPSRHTAYVSDVLLNTPLRLLKYAPRYLRRLPGRASRLHQVSGSHKSSNRSWLYFTSGTPAKAMSSLLKTSRGGTIKAPLKPQGVGREPQGDDKKMLATDLGSILVEERIETDVGGSDRLGSSSSAIAEESSGRAGQHHKDVSKLSARS